MWLDTPVQAHVSNHANYQVCEVVKLSMGQTKVMIVAQKDKHTLEEV